MNHPLPEDMLHVLHLTKAGKLIEATAAIQNALGGLSRPAEAPHLILLDAAPTSHGTWSVPEEELNPSAIGPVPVALHGMLDRLKQVSRKSPLAAGAIPEGAQFLQRQFTNEVGSRPYKLYVPSKYDTITENIPLIVMLHGCTQSADDFAAGTKMNDLAEERLFLVAYPEQTKSANPSRCWNWFNTAEQGRSGIEASLIAGITREVMREFRINPKQVYVAGLSAGGAAAAILGASYPDLYAAVGVHSGLACGAANDMPSAFNAMRKGGPQRTLKRDIAPVPTIVFHGDADKTVHSINSKQVISQSMSNAPIAQSIVEHGRSAGGISYTREVWRQTALHIHSEHWLLHGVGHAWSGGSASGSYTDPLGPDASLEMIRFFLSNPMRQNAM